MSKLKRVASVAMKKDYSNNKCTEREAFWTIIENLLQFGVVVEQNTKFCVAYRLLSLILASYIW